jgi:receptor protein-tyrosine kinase
MKIHSAARSFLDTRQSAGGGSQDGGHGVETFARARQDNSPIEPAPLPPASQPIEPGARVIGPRDMLDPRREMIRALRTELFLRRESADKANMVALLSPCAGEGRSMLAAELAMAFAQTGQATLLVDADLRHPHQHLLLGLPNDEGLAQAISGPQEPWLHTVAGLPRLSVLTSGELPGDPLELLSSQRLAALIEGWRRRFEVVVFDTAPIGRFSDGLSIASLAGRVLALSRAQHTPFKDMQDMLRRLSATQCQVVGAVVSHF